jgi:hypothetical protein
VVGRPKVGWTGASSEYITEQIRHTLNIAR